MRCSWDTNSHPVPWVHRYGEYDVDPLSVSVPLGPNLVHVEDEGGVDSFDRVGERHVVEGEQVLNLHLDSRASGRDA